MPVSLGANLLSLSTLRTLFSCFANGTLLKYGEISQIFSFFSSMFQDKSGQIKTQLEMYQLREADK